MYCGPNASDTTIQRKGNTLNGAEFDKRIFENEEPKYLLKR
jgi:hypothetical protein